MSGRTVSGTQLARILGDWRAAGPAYAELAAGLRMLVLDGRLPLRVRLPAERQLAQALRVSRTTVTAAYEELREEGYLHSRQGAGSWTALPADRHRAPEAAPWAPADRLGAPLLDLAQAALPAPEGALPQAVGAALEELPRYLPTHGYDPYGLPELRAAVADRYTERGVPTAPDDILVTNGAQHGFGLILRLLTGPGDRVLVEHPTYPNALDVVRRLGGRLVPVGLEPDGWDLDLLGTTLRQTAPRLAYLIPDFHNPTGLAMDAADRERLAELGRVTGTPLVVDETLAELWLPAGTDGLVPAAAPVPPLPPVAGYDRAGTVLSVGSMSKTFWGGLRIGWIRAAPELRRRLAALRATLDMGSPVLEQLVSARLLREAAAVLSPRRAELRRRRDALCGALREAVPEWRVNTPGGGLSLWVELAAPVSSVLVLAAEARGVRLVAGPRFGLDGAFERYLRLPFTQPEPVLLDAAGRLAAAYRAVADRSAGAGARLDPVT